MRQTSKLSRKLLYLAGFAVYLFLSRAIFMGCPIKNMFGIPCAGCGMTRAIISALQLDFVSALQFHPLFFLAPLVITYFLFDGHVFAKCLDRIIIALIAIMFGIVWILRLCGAIAWA